MKYDRAFFDRIIDRSRTDNNKWEDISVRENRAIPMQGADMDFESSKAIQAALLQRAAHGCYGYSAHNPEDTEAFVSFWRRRHHLTIQPEQTAMLPCVLTGLRLCVLAMTDPGDQVAMFTPAYPSFYDMIVPNGRKMVTIPFLQDSQTGRFSINLAALEEALKQGVKLLLFTNPNNPGSRLWSREELQALVALLKRYGAHLACDEIHADFVYAPHRHTPILSLPEAHDCTIMLASASKTFNIAGLKQAMAVSFSPDLMAVFTRQMANPGVVSGNIFALFGTRAAYTQCDDWLDGVLEYLDEGRRVLAESLEKYAPKARLIPMEATYLGWVDFRAYGKTTAELNSLFRKHGVVASLGTNFDPAADGYMRISIGMPHEKIREGIRRMGEALQES